jgi:hypothetical protein
MINLLAHQTVNFFLLLCNNIYGANIKTGKALGVINGKT